MKKIFFIFLFIIPGMFCAGQGPGLRVGPEFGLGSSGFSTLNGYGQQERLAGEVGMCISKQFARFFGLQADLLFTKTGAVVTGSRQDGQDLLGNPRMYSYTDSYDLYHVSVPLLLKFSLGFDRFYIKGFAGPAIDVNLYSKQERTYDNSDYGAEHNFETQRSDFRVFDRGLVYGLGFEFENENNTVFSFDLRMNQGLSPIGQIDGKDVYSNLFAIHAGILFR